MWNPVFKKVFSPVMDQFWSPSNLFSKGEPGIWYDPSDITTLFQDSAGTTPVTAVGQTVGRMLDKSGRNNHATQANIARRPTYQIDSSGRPYLLFDGVDDDMGTGTVTPSTNKGQVFIGLRKLSNAARAMAVELLGTGVGTINIEAPSSSLNDYSLRSGGTTTATASASPYSVPITNVVTGLGDISAPFSTIRVNGVQKTSVTTTQGTGNYLPSAIYIGRRAGASLPFNGRIYSLIMRFGPNLTTEQITANESWVNIKTGAY